MDIHQERFARLRPLQLALRALIAVEKDPRRQRALDDLSYALSVLRIKFLNGR
jgi:hypothetical protein